MSHNHNYQRDSRPEKHVPIQVSEVEDEAVQGASAQEPVEETSAPVEEPVVESSLEGGSASTPEEAPAEIWTFRGTVTDCAKLNVRSVADDSSPDSIIATIDAMTEVEVDPAASTDKFFKIRTGDGVEGFCMREYIFLHP